MRKILISMLAFLILAVSAVALNIVEDSVTIQASHGTTETGSFTVNNTDPVNAINISFSDYTLTYNSYNINVSQLANITNLSAGAIYLVPFSVIIPNNQNAGLYTGNLNATSNASVSDTVQINVNITPSYSFGLPSEIDLGTVSQNTTQITTFIVQNNGNAPLTNVNVSSDAASKYNVSFNQTTIGNLAVGENRTIKLNATIPYDESGGTKTLGNIYVRSTEYNATSSFPLKATVQGRLEIDDLDVKVDGDTDSNVDDGNTIDKKAKSESTIEFDIKIENKFSDDEDIEIENVQVTITIEGIDDGDDLEEDSSEFDLNAEESERVKLNFELPTNVDEGTYDVLIHVEGEDEDRVDHEIDWNLEIEVEKESHDIKIRKASVSPSTIDCTRRADLKFELMNIGKNDEDEVYYLVSNSALGVSIREGPFELSEDFDDDNNILEAIHTIYVKDNQAAGTYGLELRIYYDTDKIDDYKKIDLAVNDCPGSSGDGGSDDTGDDGSSSTTTDTTDSQTTTGTTDQTTIPDIISADTMPPETTFRDSTAYLGLLGLLIIIVAAGIVLSAAYYLSIRRNV